MDYILIIHAFLQVSWRAMITVLAAWVLLMMEWQWPQALGTVSLKSGIKAAR